MVSLELIRTFRKNTENASRTDGLLLPHWSDEDWMRLFEAATLQRAESGTLLIRRDDSDRALYFVASGTLEVIVAYGDGQTLGPLTRIGGGSVMGEQSFFDGEPRSANVWTVTPCDLMRLGYEEYLALEKKFPSLGRDLIFSLGRILAQRLRNTTAKVYD